MPIEKPFECAHCAKRFVKKSRLEWHLRMHNNDRPFPCTADGCNKAFFANQTLRAHLRQVHHENLPALRHSGPRPFSPSNDTNEQHQQQRMPSVNEVVERLSAADTSGRDSVMSDISQSSVVVLDSQHEVQHHHQQQQQQQQHHQSHLQGQQQQQHSHQQQHRQPILPISESFHPMSSSSSRSRFRQAPPDEAPLQQQQHSQVQQQQQQPLQSRSLLEQRQQLMEVMKDIRTPPLAAARVSSLAPGSSSTGSAQFPSHSFVLQQQHERHVQEQLLLQQQQQQQQRLQQQQQRQHQVFNYSANLFSSKLVLN